MIRVNYVAKLQFISEKNSMPELDLDITSLQWFRLYTEFSTDPKVQSLSEAMQRRFIMILCFYAKGDLQKWSDKQISYALRISEKEWQKTLKIFKECSFVDDDLNIINWNKRQYRSDHSRSRVRAHRKRVCNVTSTLQSGYSNGNVTLQSGYSNGDVTPPETETETETEKVLNKLSSKQDLSTRSEILLLLDEFMPGFHQMLVVDKRIFPMICAWVEEGVIAKDVNAAYMAIRWKGIQKIMYYENVVRDFKDDRINNGNYDTATKLSAPPLTESEKRIAKLERETIVYEEKMKKMEEERLAYET